MNYTMLVRPHANSRYQQSVLPLARAELFCMLRREGLSAAQAIPREALGAQWLDFSTDGALSETALARLSAHSALQLLFLRGEDGTLTPLCGSAPAALGGDLPSVLKYKGKTNESFTAHLLNMAWLSASFDPQEPLWVLDPMCGRGTTLFTALNRGWNALGADLDAGDVAECGRYFKRYLEYHRVKHQMKNASLTLRGKGVPVQEFTFGAEARSLSLLCADACDLPALLKKRRFHLIAADLPYGVQHAPGAQQGEGGKKVPGFAQALRKWASAWRELLLPGGAVAISFNVNTLPSQTARQALAEAGLAVRTGEGYDGLAHWVEQAITRDVAVAVRE